ncbi:MAG: hypothetical protein IJS14_09780 [Lentisphaeria bacterium]|nr:hypothetical protein [Lentisphaeria bacterium]
MKKNTWFSMIALTAAFFLAVLFEAKAEMDPKEAVELIENTFTNVLDAAETNPDLKKKIVDPTRSAWERSDLSRYFKLYKKVVAYLEAMQFAASLTNDLIQLGLKTNEKSFATAFAKSFKVYLRAYTSPREFDNFLLQYRFNEDDLQTVLYDLGRNFYRALDQQTNKAQLREAGRAIQNMTPAEIARYVKVPKSVQKQLDAYQRDALEQTRKQQKKSR